MYWILLIAGAIFALTYVVVKIRHHQLATADAVFWFLFALTLIIVSIFPQIVFFFSNLLGFESPANLVFLCLLIVVIYASCRHRWKTPACVRSSLSLPSRWPFLRYPMRARGMLPVRPHWSRGV